MGDDHRLVWIDCAKFAAIVAVMIDHTKGILYADMDVAIASDYSVSLFILLAGITSYLSAEKYVCKNAGGRAFLKKTRKMITAYCIATFIYGICFDGSFDLLIYVNRLVRFNASGPFYFVLLYIELMLIFWPLYKLFSMCDDTVNGFIKEAVIWCIVVLAAVITTNYTNILDVYGGGGKLFGGTYLILFVTVCYLQSIW